MTATLAVTTTAVLAAGIPACDFCDADMALREIGEGVDPRSRRFAITSAA